MPDVAKCKICEIGELLDRLGARIGVCLDCRVALGIAEMPPARRRADPCAKCNGMKFVRVIPREYADYWTDTGTFPRGAPMALTREAHTTKRFLLPGRSVGSSPSVGEMRGVLETYVCKGCGFVEWY